MRLRVAAGFSLAENIVALAILSAGLLGTTALFGEALRSVRDNRHRQAALLHGEALLDTLLALQVDTLPGPLECSFAAAPCLADASAQAELAAWRTALLRALPDARVRVNVFGPPEIRSLRLQISWPDSRGEIAIQRLERTVHR